MGARAAEIEAADGGFVAGPIEGRAHREKLVKSEFAMGDVAAGETVSSLEIVGSDDLHVLDEAGEIGGVLGESFEDGKAKLATCAAPVPFAFLGRGVTVGFIVGRGALGGVWDRRRSGQLEGSELDVGGEDMLAVGSEGGIEEGGNGDVEIRSSGKFAVLGGVKGALEIIDFWADVDATGERLESVFGVFERGKRGKTVEGEMNFGDSAVGADIADAEGEGGIELRGIEELEKGALGIDTRNDGMDFDFLAIGQDETGDGAVFDQDVLDFGVGAELGTGFASGVGENAGEGTESTAGKCGGAHRMGIGSGAQQ